jgi:hypothetical protein
VREVGRIVRLQVQTGSLKLGERPNRVYDPAPLAEVPRLRLSPRGAAGQRGALQDVLLDVHHANHPVTKWEAGREASFGFTSHYARMRDEYGDHLANGCAGENVLLESASVWRLEDFAAGLAFRSESTGGLLRLSCVTVADPCVEFSRYSIRNPQASSQDIKPVLQFLGEGTRGYVFTPDTEGEVAIGDRLMLLA